MGCDIHTAAEYRDADGIWRAAGTWALMSEEDARDYGIELDERPLELKSMRPYSGRDYGLFGVLAGVRYEPPFEPLAAERGLPDDLSDEVARDAEGADWHSHSHCTLAEILAFDWRRTTPNSYFVSAENYAWWRWHCEHYPKYEPEQMFPWREPGHWKRIDSEQMVAAFDTWQTQDKAESFGKHMSKVYCELTVEVPLHIRFKRFWHETVPYLASLGAPEDVRLVFWFDN